MEPDGTTVVIATHQRRDELLRTLAHMTSLPDAAPIIVADNASTDGTSEAVRREFPGVRLIRLEQNLGAVARNVAVEQVETPCVTFCDDDTRWQAGSLERVTELLGRHPGIGAVMGRCLVEPDLTEDPLTPELRYSPVPAPHWLPGPALLSVMAGLTTFRTEAFRQVGGFSRDLWFCGEEELLALDLAARGWWLCSPPDVVVHHAPSKARDARWRRRLGLRNTLLTTWLRRPAGSALRRSAQVLSSAPKDRCTASAVLQAARRWPRVRDQRQVVPPDVERGLRLLEEPQRRSAARRYVG